MNAALVILGATALAALLLGVRAGHGRDMNLEQWTVGARGFGSVLVFLLMAGEIYTTFTFLGASGYAYGHGAPAFYILAYGALAYVLSYWLLPPIWRYAKEHGLLSQADFLAAKYDSPALGALVALVGIIALIPYLVLQFKGLGIIVATASYGTVPPTVAVWVGAVVVAVYVVVSGVRGSAWTAAAKDILIFGVALFLGIYLPFHYYGGIGPMFAAVEHARPGFLALPTKGESVAWFDSTVLLTALGFYMWPHTFGSLYTAKHGEAFRKNAIFLPLYQLVLLLVFFVDFAAILQVPGLSGSDIDLSLLRLSIRTFDPWFVGVIGAAGVLAALVPSSMILIGAATLLANNLYRLAHPTVDAARVALMVKCLVPLVTLVGVYFTLQGGATIVALLLMGYSFVTQLFPAVAMSLAPANPMTRFGAIVGIAVGVATVAAATLTHTTIAAVLPGAPQPIRDLNSGIVALALNIASSAIVSLFTQTARRPAPQER